MFECSFGFALRNGTLSYLVLAVVVGIRCEASWNYAQSLQASRAVTMVDGSTRACKFFTIALAFFG